MTTQLIMMAILMALGVGYTTYVTKKRKAGMPEAFRMFFERTGYRYADIYNQPLEAHIMHGERLMANAGDGYHIHMLRDFHGMQIHSVQDSSRRKEDGRTIISRSAAWWAPLSTPARIRVQIAEQSLAGLGKAVKEAFSNQKRVWKQELPVQVTTGDPELDKRFLFFGVDRNEVISILNAPGFRDLLLGCAEVDLRVDQDKVIFSDPSQKNLTAGMGGYVGAMALTTDIVKTMELTIPVHDRIAELLALTARVCQ